jgi:phospholipid-binding lipoprotein MlaA
MSARQRTPNDLCYVILFSVVCCFAAAPAFALDAVVSQASPANQKEKAATNPQVSHTVKPGARSSGDGHPIGNADEDTLIIPEHYETIQDPLAPVNEKSFRVNDTIDQRAVRPISSLWSRAVPVPVQHCIARFFDNAEVTPRFANALFQLRFKWAGGELARFGINSTIGVAGLFDPAQAWFGLKEHDNSFALTLARYGMTRGLYLMPPVGSPIDTREVIGGVIDGMMNPLNYVLPGSYVLYKLAAHSLEGLNSAAQKQGELDEVDRYAIDKYGAVQDAYVQKQSEQEQAVKRGRE